MEIEHRKAWGKSSRLRRVERGQQNTGRETLSLANTIPTATGSSLSKSSPFPIPQLEVRQVRKKLGKILGKSKGGN